MTPEQFYAKYSNQQARPKYSQVLTTQGIRQLDQSGNIIEPKRQGLAPWLPAAGAIGLGLAAAPFTGGMSLVPALLTAGGAAALGGGLGEFGAQKISGEKTNIGKIGKEAAISGLLGAGGEAFSAARAAKAAGIGAEQAFKMSPQALQEAKLAAKAVKAGEAGGILARSGQRLTAASAGMKLEPGIGNVANQELASQVFAKRGLTGTPRQILGNTPKVMNSIQTEIDQALQTAVKNGTKMSGSKVTEFTRQAITDPTKYADIPNSMESKAFQSALKAWESKFATAKSPLQINEIVKSVNPVAIKAEKALMAGSPISDRAAAAIVAKRSGDEALSTIVDKAGNAVISPLKREMAVIIQNNPAITAAANKGVSLPLHLQSIPGLKPVGESARYLGSKLGAGMQGAGGVLTQALSTPLARQAAYQVGGRALTGMTAAPDNSQYDVTGQSTFNAPEGVYGGTMDMSGQSQQQMQQIQQGQLAQALQMAMLQDLQQTGGKRIAALKSVYDIVAPQKNIAMSKASQEQQNNILTALSALDASEYNLLHSGGAKGPLAGATANLPVAGQYINPKGYTFNKTRIETATQLAKALTGSTRPAKEVTMQYLHSLPAIDDTPQVASYKLNILRNDILKRAQATGLDISAYAGQSLGQATPSASLQSAILGVRGY